MKNILKTIQTIVLFLFILFGKNLGAQVTCSGGTTNIPRSGTVTVNGVTINTTYTGDVQSYPYGAWSSCSGAVTTSNNSLAVGTGSYYYPENPSPWSFTLNFNKPVNDLVIVLTATGTSGSSSNENFIFNSNGGTVSITAGTNCYSTISGNQIISGSGAPLDTSGTSGGGGGLFKITASSAYTQLTINGNGGLFGSLMAICGLSIKPACIAGTIAPQVSSLNYSCPATSVNLATAHTETIPSGATLVWYTNNTHTGTALTASEIANAGAGTYYAFYYDSTNNCYSPVSSPVVITNLTTLDSDGDGVSDACDLDDDNDGILDAEESPNCFYTVYEANRVASVISTLNGAGADPVAGVDIPLLYNDNTNDGAVTTAYNFASSQTITSGSTIFTVKYPTPIAIKSLSVAQAANGMASSGYTKLYGSTDGINYTLLTAGNGISIASTTVNFNNTSTTEYLYYQIRYIGTSTSGNTTSVTAGTAAIHEIYSLAASTTPAYNPSAHPKPGACNDDLDNDGIPNHLDSDSDGDGCSDAYEGSTTTNKTVSVIPGPYGANGLANSLETSTESGMVNYVSTYRKYAAKLSQKLCLDTDNDGVPNPIDLDDDNDGVLDTTEGDFCGKLDRNIRVGYLNVGAGNNGLATNLLYNLNNFGTNGVYNKVRGVTLIPFAATSDITEANLLAQNIDVFFVGSSANDATTSTDKIPTVVNTILTTWAKNNGKVIFALQNNAGDYGYTITNNNSNPNTPVGVLGRDYYTNGYWPTPSLNQSGTVQMTIKSLTRTFDFLMLDANLRPVVITDREYSLVIFPDATIYNNESATATPTTNDQKAIADTWSYVFDKFLETQCTSLDTDGDLTPNYLDLDSDQDGCSDAVEAGATKGLAISVTSNFAFVTNAGTPTDSNSDGLADIVDTNLNGIPDYLDTYHPQAINNTIKQCTDSDDDGYLDINDLDDDNDGILDTDEGQVCNSLNRNLRIGYVNTTLGKNGLMINMLSNAANFSSAGTYNKFPGIIFVPYASQAAITEAQLLTDNIDIFYVGSSAQDAQTSSDKLLTTTNTIIKDWATNNDKGVIVLQNNATDYGFQVNNNNVNNNIPYASLGESVFTNGYWPVNVFAQSGTVQMTINSSTRNYETSMVDATGKATFVRDRDEKIVFIPDATIFNDNETVSAIGTNATLKVAADVWAFAFDVFISGTCTTTDTDGDGIPNHLDLDSDNDGCPDAIEGGDNFTSSSLVNSSMPGGNSGATSGTYNQPVIQNLGNNVGNTATTMGVPTIANTGQTVGDSQNFNISICLQPFVCDGNIYLSISTSASTPTTLYSVNYNVIPYTMIAIGNNAHGIAYNSIGYNKIDNYIYAVSRIGNTLYKIGNDGTVQSLGIVAGLPSDSYLSGDILSDGNTFIVRANGTSKALYSINIANRSATLLTTLTDNIADLAYNATNNLLYSATNTTGKLISINPVTGAIVEIGNTNIASAFGAMFGTESGKIFGVDNAGSIYQFDLTTGNASLIQNISGYINQLDGTSCLSDFGSSFCYKPAATSGTVLDTNHGITSLGRAVTDNGNWPMVRKGAWTALEAKTKGFVVNRIATTASVEAIANPIEGMMVYDEESNCLKINIDGTTTGWKCFNTQTCP